MPDPRRAYDDLLAHLREAAVLDSCSAVLGWDERTQLPPKGTGFRGEQQALLARLSHQRKTDPKVGEWLAAIESSDLVSDADSESAAVARELRRDYDKSSRLPTALVEALSLAATAGERAWERARADADFSQFRPHLEKMLGLKRQEAACLGTGEGDYDALLDAFEPGETAENLRRVFGDLRPRLVDLVNRIVDCGRAAPVEVINRRFPMAKQEAFGRDAAAARFGYDFAGGRLDRTVHPFATGIGPGDARITTRYDEDYFNDAFFSIAHEAGHGLYEQGLPKDEHFGSPLAEAVSLGIHESQSRLWENLVGRSRAYWTHAFPAAQAAFAPTLDGVSADQFHFAVNAIAPSLIRVEADEATYNLHIMLRFELEQALLSGDLSAADLPGAWNEKYRDYLGLTPPDDREGCLQDVHWSFGAIGYFPTYSLGNLYASQFFETADKELGGLDALFARGEFRPLLDWLRTNIHHHGRRYTASELVQNITGEPLSAEPLMRHLTKKASDLYGV